MYIHTVCVFTNLSKAVLLKTLKLFFSSDSAITKFLYVAYNVYVPPHCIGLVVMCYMINVNKFKFFNFHALSKCFIFR